MTEIAIQFVLGADWSSRFIAWYGQGYGGYSHVDAVLADGSLIGARSDRIGGVSPGVQHRPANYARWKRRTLVTFPHTEGAYPGWVSWLDRQIGAGYDKGDILGFILGVSLMQEGHWICSALQDAALEQKQLLPPTPIPPQQITPNSLYLMCIAAGATSKELPVTPI